MQLRAVDAMHMSQATNKCNTKKIILFKFSEYIYYINIKRL